MTANRIHRLAPTLDVLGDYRETLCGRKAYAPADGSPMRTPTGAVLLTTEYPDQTTCVVCTRVQP